MKFLFSFCDIRLPFSILFSAITIITAQHISPGSTLHASNPQKSWNSPNRSFTFSFIQQSENTFFAAVTFNGIPIWKAGGDPGGAVNSSAELRFLPDGNLRLVTGPAGFSAWQSNTSGLGITSASLENSGNFVLKNGNLSIWTTFDNPTDTILPGQNFTVDHVLTCGFYSFHLLGSGIALRWNNSIEYYSSTGVNTTSHLNLTSPSLVLQQAGIFMLFDPSLSTGQVIMARSNDYGEIDGNTLRFVQLGCDGNMRIYSSNGIVRWTAVSDQCDVFGYCGSFGICRYGGINADPVCECPSANFDPVDLNDRRSGCRRRDDFRNCQTTMLSLNNTLFLTLAPDTVSDIFTANIEACSNLCLADTLCVASTSLADGSGVCYMKRSDFVSGYQSPTLTSTSFVKVCRPIMLNPQFSQTVNNKNTLKSLAIVIIVLGSGFVIFIFVGVFSWFYIRSKPRYDSILTHYSFSDYVSGMPVQFSYKELRKGTKGFKEKLGGGGFGSVYKGVVAGKITVGVKKLEGIGQGEKQFRTEVAVISSTHHLNLVRLVGFCSEGRHRLLVYEFMKNGSLDSFLFNSDENKRILNWERRFGIALGTAKGLTYLHQECRDCILHCDVKPENILLDDSFNARISDFGLAKLLNMNDHRHRSLMAVRGTRGYLAPEWVANMPIDSKADVYGYGMVLLEIVSGRRNFEVSGETDHKKFSLWAYEEFEKGNVSAVLDKQLTEEDVDMDQAVRVIQVSFWCVQEQPALRPTMGRVVQMLQGIGDVLEAPPPLAKVEGLVQSVISCVSSVI